MTQNTSKHIGTIGKRMRFFVKCVKVRAFESSFKGRYKTYTYMNHCVDRYGNVIVYKGSNRWVENNFYSIDATVKSHDEYKEVLQTWIQRPAYVNVLDPEGKKVTP